MQFQKEKIRIFIEIQFQKEIETHIYRKLQKELQTHIPRNTVAKRNTDAYSQKYIAESLIGGNPVRRRRISCCLPRVHITDTGTNTPPVQCPKSGKVHPRAAKRRNRCEFTFMYTFELTKQCVFSMNVHNVSLKMFKSTIFGAHSLCNVLVTASVNNSLI